MGDVLSAGMIGAGGIAQSHMRAIQANDNIQLVAVMDVVPERAQAAVDKYGGKAYTNMDDLLGDKDVEAVHVCTPHSLHVDQVVAAAKAEHLLHPVGMMELEEERANDVVQAGAQPATRDDAGACLLRIEEQLCGLPPEGKQATKLRQQREEMEKYLKDREQNWRNAHFLAVDEPSTRLVLVVEGVK